MRYEIGVNNETQVMLVVRKADLDDAWDRVMAHGNDPHYRFGFLYALLRLGLLDDDLKPNWR